MFSELQTLENLMMELWVEEADGNLLYWCILCTPTHLDLHSMLLTPHIEKKLLYVIEEAAEENYARYMSWIYNEISPINYPDIIRFIMNNTTRGKYLLKAQLIILMFDETKD